MLEGGIKMKEVKVLLLNDGKLFEKKLNDLVNQGFKIITGNFADAHVGGFGGSRGAFLQSYRRINLLFLRAQGESSHVKKVSS